MKKWAAFASAHILLLSFGFSVPGSAVVSKSSPSQSSPFVLPIAKRDSLLNGLQLITLEQQNTGAVAAHLRINSGGIFDLAGKGGLADITAGMLAVALYSGVVVLGAIDAIQLEAGGLPSRLPAEDARRVRFDELHQLSTRLMMTNVIAALALLYWEARDYES